MYVMCAILLKMQYFHPILPLDQCLFRDTIVLSYYDWKLTKLRGTKSSRIHFLTHLCKFPGQQLLNWYVGSFPDDHYLRMLLTTQDLRILGAQFCTHMLAAGVLKQIPDKDAPLESVFRPDLMYVWSHSEMTATTPITPGRLPSNLWSQTVSPIGEGLPSRTGPRYSEAGKKIISFYLIIMIHEFFF